MPRSSRRPGSQTRKTAHRSAADGRSRGNGRSPVRYAVIGLGHIAQVAVLPAFRNARRNSALAALVSDDPRKLRELGRRYEVSRLCGYEDADELFRSGEIDAAYIALPNTLTVRAARAGLHVLCEKPMAIHASECERMSRACKDADVKLMIAYRLHFERATLEVAKLVRDGRLGEPRFQGVNETVTAVLRFPQDRVATFTCSFASADRSRYEVVGTKGNIIVEPAYEYAEGLAYELTVGGRTRKKRFAKSDQFAAELLYFSDCVRDGREPEPSGLEGLTDVRILEAIRRSADSGRWVSLERKVRQRRRRPTLRQEIRRPGIPKPQTIDVRSPHH